MKKCAIIGWICRHFLRKCRVDVQRPFKRIAWRWFTLACPARKARHAVLLDLRRCTDEDRHRPRRIRHNKRCHKTPFASTHWDYFCHLRSHAFNEGSTVKRITRNLLWRIANLDRVTPLWIGVRNRDGLSTYQSGNEQ